VTEIRALTIKQPWEACIAANLKLVENRTWQVHYRDMLAIHAGRNTASNVPDFAEIAFYQTPLKYRKTGAILAVARLDDCHPYEPGCCVSRWAEKQAGVFHWTLTDVVPLGQPIPALGRQGLWTPSERALEALCLALQIGVAR
jgi:hypothetical protein